MIFIYTHFQKLSNFKKNYKKMSFNNTATILSETGQNVLNYQTSQYTGSYKSSTQQNYYNPDLHPSKNKRHRYGANFFDDLTIKDNNYPNPKELENINFLKNKNEAAQKLLHDHEKIKNIPLNHDPEDPDSYNKNYAGRDSLNHQYLKRPENLIQKSLFKARFEDKDIDLGNIFKNDNTHYRQKFKPHIDQYDHNQYNESSVQSEPTKIGRKLYSVYDSPTDKAKDRQNSFNKQYKGNYDFLEIKNYKVFENNQNYLNHDEESNLLSNDINIQQKKDEYGIRFDEDEKDRRQRLQDQIQHDKRDNFSIITPSGEVYKKTMKKGILKHRSPEAESSFQLPPLSDFTSTKNIPGSPAREKSVKSVRLQSAQSTSLIREEDPKKIYDRHGDLYRCPEGCGRKFAEKNLENHVKICKNIFQTKRREFDSEKQREINKWDKQFKSSYNPHNNYRKKIMF